MHQQHGVPARLRGDEPQCRLVERETVGIRQQVCRGESLKRGTGAFDVLIHRNGHGARRFDVTLLDQRALLVR